MTKDESAWLAGVGFLALAATWTWLQPRSTLPEPIHSSASAPLPRTREIARASVVKLAAPADPLAAVIDHGPRAAADWIQAKNSQEWVWPNRLSPLKSFLNLGHFSAEESPDARGSGRLVGWFPADPAGHQVRYATGDEQQVAHLFNQPIVDFGELERRIGYSAPARGGPAAGPAAAPQPASGNQPHAAPRHAGARPHPSFSVTARAYRGAASRGVAAASSWRGSAAHQQGPAQPAAAQQPYPELQPIAGAQQPDIAPQPIVAAQQPDPAPQLIAAAQQPYSAPTAFQKLRAEELAGLQKSKGSVSARDVTAASFGSALINFKWDGVAEVAPYVGDHAMAELTYADGRTQVVPYDPLVFDLKGGGVKTDSRKVLFDLYGYGKTDKLQWMNDVDEGTGILVFDATGSGRSGKNGSEVFGDRTDLSGVGRPDGFANGFEALRALVKKAVAEKVLIQDAVDGGVLDAAALAALERAYGLRVKVGGFNRKTVSLAEAGVDAIALSDAKAQRIENFDGRDNSLVVQPGAVFRRRDGTTGYYMNIWLQAQR